jgi:antitoxin component YwqK of YwqJK toxin-antitoxin module
MLRSKKLLPILIISAFMSGVRAQQIAQTEERSAIIIERGIERHNEKKYDEAISEYKKVHRNDSNYYLAGAELLNTLLAQEKNEEGLAYCDHLLKLKNDYTPNILLFKGDFLDNLGKYEEAEKIYKKGITDYPLNHGFYFEQAISKIRKKKYEEGYELLTKALKLNPFHASSHYQLGLMAYRSNNVTAAMLAFQFFLICDHSSKRAAGTVIDLEKIAKTEMEFDSIVKVKIFDGQNDFSEMESLLKSKVALTKKYKSKVDLNYDLLKQMQILVENIGKYSDVPGFYNEFYGKYFSVLNQKKMFEPLSYYILGGLNIEKVDKWAEKNKSEMTAFREWTYEYMCTEMARFPEVLNGKTITVPHWYSGGAIMGAGERTKDGMNNGYWNYYYKNGIRKSEGEFIAGKKNGSWKYYYPNGQIKEKSEFANDEQKYYNSFYHNNNPEVELAVENNQVTGEKKVYYSNGNLASSTTYKNGQINGPQKYYYRNGAPRYTITNTNGVISGDLLEYFDNGKKYQTVKFVNGNREGPSKTYFNNTDNTVASEGNYLKGQAVGDWKNYYQSGALYKTQTFNNDGEREGLLKEFYENGKTQLEEQYSNGHLSGLSKMYNEDGSLWQEFLYKKKKLIEYRAFKPDGTRICDNKINGKNFKLALYHPNGVKRREGEVSDGELTGVWKDYNTYGVLVSEANYVEGNYDGKYLNYHGNGKVQKERYFIKGKENGLHKTFYINGKAESEGMVVNDDYEGYWTYYYKDGSIKSKLFYIGSELEGWSEYYDTKGRLDMENLNSEYCLIKVVYHDTAGAVLQNIDLPGGNGTLERKTMDGKVVYVKKFEKDYPQGVATSYYPDGTIESTAEYNKGKKEGKSVYYNALGKIVNEVKYFNGEKTGKEKSYDEDGKLSSDYNYYNGDYHGVGISYHANGKVSKDAHYEYGDAEGESSLFDEAGELIYKRIFHHNLLVSYTYKDAVGNLLPPKVLGTGETKLVCYFQNGKKSLDASYLNGDLHGKRIMYHSNGKVMDDTDYYYDTRHGESKEYYANGTLKEIENYYYGSSDGVSRGYYENGKLKWERNYKMGELHGWCTFHEANGAVKKKVLYHCGEAIK